MGDRPLGQIWPVISRWPHLVTDLEDRVDRETRDGTLDASGRELLIHVFGLAPWIRRWAFPFLERLELNATERTEIQVLSERRSPELRQMCAKLLGPSRK